MTIQAGDTLVWRHRISNYGHMDHTRVVVKHRSARRVTVRSDCHRGGPRLHSVPAGALASNWCQRLGIAPDKWCTDCRTNEEALCK